MMGGSMKRLSQVLILALLSLGAAACPESGDKKKGDPAAGITESNAESEAKKVLQELDNF